MMKLINILIIFSFIIHSAFSQQTRQEYITKYKDLAIKEMKRVGIPASITLAQGLLESDNGNSFLARKANNHFGIKCHNWSGKKVYKDDDKKNECFRKYKSVEESFLDHSEFLLRDRYANLFKLDINDYKAWAKGLKKAGYATNPKYPQMLIKIIEDNNLYEFDNPSLAKSDNSKKSSSKSSISSKRKSKTKTDSDFSISTNSYEIKSLNNIEYIIARKGDTFTKLTKKFNKLRFELPKYNELPANAELSEGQIIFLQPKKKKAERGKNYHTAEAGETIYEISQMYGIKISSLCKKNHLRKDQKLETGTRLWLRKTKPQ